MPSHYTSNTIERDIFASDETVPGHGTGKPGQHSRQYSRQHSGDGKSRGFLLRQQPRGGGKEETPAFRFPPRSPHLRCSKYGDAVFEYKVPGEKSLWFPYTCDVCENCLIYRLEKSVARYLAGTLGDGEQTIIIVTGFETPAAVREYTGLDCHADRLHVKNLSVVCRHREGGWAALLIYAGVMEEKKRRKAERHALGLGLEATVDVRRVGGMEFAELVPLQRSIFYDEEGDVVDDLQGYDEFVRGKLHYVRTLQFNGNWPEPDTLPLDYIKGESILHSVDDPAVPAEAVGEASVPEEVAADIETLRFAWKKAPLVGRPLSEQGKADLLEWHTVREEMAYKYSRLWMAEFPDAGLPALRLAICVGDVPSFKDRRIWGWWHGPKELVEHVAAYWRGDVPWRNFYAPVLKRLGLVSIYPSAAEKERQPHQGTAYGPLFGSEPVIVEDVPGSMMFASVRAQMQNPAEKKTVLRSPFVFDSEFTMAETAQDLAEDSGPSPEIPRKNSDTLDDWNLWDVEDDDHVVA